PTAPIIAQPRPAPRIPLQTLPDLYKAPGSLPELYTAARAFVLIIALVKTGGFTIAQPRRLIETSDWMSHHQKARDEMKKGVLWMGMALMLVAPFVIASAQQRPANVEPLRARVVIENTKPNEAATTE